MRMALPNVGRLCGSVHRGMCTASSIRRVAFLGLGNMGLPMASNLQKAGFELAVYDPASTARDICASAGLPEPCESAASAAANADAVVAMLPNGSVCEKLFLGSSGLLSTLALSTLVMDCSTIDAPTAQRIGAAASAVGVQYLDTPVSGGTAVAQAGNLAFMCGGEASAFERARPVLAGMGPAEKTFHAGVAGSGQIAKACNNMLLAIHMVGTCEALAMGAASGMDPAVLSEILKASSGRNWSLDVYNPYPGVMAGVPSSRGYTGGFKTDLMVKDLGLAVEVAELANVDVQMGALARRLYEAHQAAGSGTRDFSSIMTAIARDLDHTPDGSQP